MSLFEFNPFRASEELTPPQLRGEKMMAWLRVLLRPLKYFSELFLEDYLNGSNAPEYDNATTYYKYDRVKYIAQGVWECRVDSSVGVKPVSSALSSTNWLKVLPSHIGANERVKYNSQLIVFEYAINRWYSIEASPYIYIDYVGASPNMGSANINIHFPLAVYNTLGATNAERFDNVNQFFEKYAPAGTYLTVITTY